MYCSFSFFTLVYTGFALTYPEAWPFAWLARMEGGYALRYEMTNGNGGVDSAFVQVEVTSSAEIPFPSADDHYVLDSELEGTDRSWST